MSIYAVNGKEPIAAWIPSLDTAGNGTTTLTDLVGSNNGTLTNMDAATDWVADTDAGGVRALDFDGVNDVVALGTGLEQKGELAISAWFKTYTITKSGAFVRQIITKATNTLQDYALEVNRTSGKISAIWGDSIILVSDINLQANVWYHVCLVRYGVTSNWGVNLYVNGVLDKNVSTDKNPNAGANTVASIGHNINVTSVNTSFLGLIDDVRIWNVAIDATDVAALYASGLGRGITFGGVDKWALLRRGNRMGHIGIQSSPNQHIARGIRMAQMGITL